MQVLEISLNHLSGNSALRIHAADCGMWLLVASPTGGIDNSNLPASFGILLGAHTELLERHQYAVIYGICIIVLGGIVTTQVRRISRLNLHLEPNI